MKRWGSGLDNNYQLGSESMRATCSYVEPSSPNSTPLTIKQTLSQMLFAVGGV